MTTTTRERKAIKNKDVDLRNSLWPNADQRLWDRNQFGGFASIPKTMPLVMRLMDELSKNYPLSSTYLTLWCWTWDNSFVRLNRPAEMAFAAGFTGQRGERTWQDRMKRLAELGFIEVQPSGNARLGLAFIPNPHEVIFRLHDDPKTRLPAAAFNAFIDRAQEIGCKDVAALLEGKKSGSKPATPSPAPVTPSPTPSSPRRRRLAKPGEKA